MSTYFNSIIGFTKRMISFHRLFHILLIFMITDHSFSQDTLVLQPDSFCGKDALIRSLSPNTNYSNNVDFNAHAWTNSGTPVTHRSLIEFDLSAIPLNSTIIGAYLSLYSYNSTVIGTHSTLSGSNEAVLQQITNGWNENTLTWGNQPPTTTVNQVILPQSTSAIQDYLNIDVTAMIQDMINNPTTGHGFLFKLTNEQYYRRMLFASSDNPDPNLHPKIEIIYSSTGTVTQNSLNLGNDTILCPNDSFLLDASILGATYLWQDGSVNSTFNVTQQGTYWVEVSTCSMVFYDTINVNYFLPQNLNLGNDTTLCQGASILLDATTLNATYLWQDGSTNPTYNVSQQGSYWVELTVNNCSTTDTINITIDPLPAINLGNDTLICQGDSLILDATLTNASYLWQDNSINSTFNVTQQGTYWVELMVNNCSSTDSINIGFVTMPVIDLGVDTTLCQGELLIIDAFYPNASYLWQDGSGNPNYSVTQNGSYWLEFTLNGCIETDTININYISVPNFDLGNDTTICEGEAIVLDATLSNVSYLWQDGSDNPTLAIYEQGTYSLAISNQCGTTTESMNLSIDECGCYVYLPNVFTPDNNGVNDTFYPKFECDFNKYELLIFNRWGGLIFQTNNQYQHWDGSYKGGLVPTGVYVYLLKYTFNDNSYHQKTGHVTLMK